MEIAIIGTSNSVMRGGYTYGLTDHPAVTRLNNYSLGGSGTVLLAKVCHDVDVSQYDVVVLDFAVNEDFWTQTGRCTIEEVRERLVDFISRRLTTRTMPVIAILPSMVGLNEMRPVHEFFRQFAETYCLPLFDGYQYIERLAELRGCEKKTLFHDRDHMTRENAYRFGTIMGDALVTMLTAAGTAAPAEALREMTPRFDFIPLDAFKLISGERVTRKTSLTQADFYHLEAGQSVTVNFGETVRLVGIGANLAQSNDFVEMKSEKDVRQLRITSPHFKGDKVALVYTVLPFKYVEGSDFVLTARRREATEPSRIEIAGLVVRRSEEDVAIPNFGIPHGQNLFDFGSITE